MKTVRLRVHHGQLIGDAPSSLSEGAIIHAVITDRDDEMSADERAALEEGLDESWAQLEAGDAITAEVALRKIAAIR